MLAAHRDQENLVVSHQVPSKQQHKTPGARFPKTPSRYPQHDENAPTAFAGKTGLGGPSNFGGDKTIMKTNGKRPALVTPMEGRSRAPLGNKTTNAKARTGQVGGVKNIVKEIEKSQLKPTTVQKPKSELAPVDFKVATKQKALEEEEPEYAPPKPRDLPYESDVLPAGGLTVNGLKDENLFKGYYQHFYNPVDEHGVTKQEREFEETMKGVYKKAEERNQREMDGFEWNIADISSPETTRKLPVQPTETVRRVKRAPAKQLSTMTSRRAVSALSVHSDATKSAERRIASAAQPAKARKPLSSLLQTKRSVSHNAPNKTTSGARAVGEAASRTTIGYSKGRSASSMFHTQRPGSSEANQSVRSAHSSTSIESGLSELTITPARLRQAAIKKQEAEPRPQFMSIFDEDEDEDLPALNNPLDLAEDEEEFELKLEI